jgi:hypothetical protein
VTATLPVFAPVVVEPEAAMPATGAELYVIEVVIGAVTVRLPRSVDSATLGAVVRAVRRRHDCVSGQHAGDLKRQRLSFYGTRDDQ